MVALSFLRLPPIHGAFDERKVFRWSVGVSLAAHVVILLSFLLAALRIPKQAEETRLEVIYPLEVKEIVEAPEIGETKMVQSREQIRPEAALLDKDVARSEPVWKDSMEPDAHLKMFEKQQAQLSLLTGKRQVSIPLLDSEKISNPQYKNYHDRIRAKIQNRAYFYVNDPRFEPGEVYLTFVLLADGTLRDVKILPDRTHASEFLCGVGLRSIKEAVPFPPFPAELTYPELTFNVVISFQIEE